jgi:hypothetical protein
MSMTMGGRDLSMASLRRERPDFGLRLRVVEIAQLGPRAARDLGRLALRLDTKNESHWNPLPPLTLLGRRRHALEVELLQAGAGLRDVDVALRIRRDVVAGAELAA